MDLNDVLVDLYLRSPAEFIAVRTARVRAARVDGDAELARAISRLPKPSAAAWLVNLLSARRTAEIERLVLLGTSMREAADGPDASELRRLGKERLLRIRSITGMGTDLSADAGHRMSAAALDDVQQTLQAAMADDRAAAAVMSGRLIRALSSNGIDPVDVDGSVAMASMPVTRTPRPTLHVVDSAGAGRRLAEAENTAARTRAAAAEAAAARLDIASRRTGLADRRAALETERDDLTERLTAIDRELASADRDDEAIGRALASADRNTEVAQRAAERAEKRLVSLGTVDPL